MLLNKGEGNGWGTVALVALLVACGTSRVPDQTAVPSTAPAARAAPTAPAVQPAPAAQPAATLEFPWPEDLTPSAEEPCRDAEIRVRAGLAFWDDLWLSATCVVHRLPYERQAAFVEQVLVFRSKAVDQSVTVLGSGLPKDLLGAYDGNPNARVDLYVRNPQQREILASKPEAHLGLGTWRGVCLPWQEQRGHSDVTQQALVELGPRGFVFSADAIAVITDAAQDPDFFAWKLMQAHGQTEVDANARPIDVATAKSNFVKFVREHVNKAVTACNRAAQDDDALKRTLYWIGYSLHPIQDLAPHRGRTNPEHAYNAEKESNPDTDDAAITLARNLSVDFLDVLLRKRLQACVHRFGTYAGGAVSPLYKLGTLGLRFDNSPLALLAYKKSSKAFELIKGEPGARVRWMGDAAKRSPELTCNKNPGCPELFAELVK